MYGAEKKQKFEEEDKPEMLIDVKLFASCRDLIGKDKITLKFENQITVGDLRKKILDLYPVLSRTIRFAIAINYEIVDETTYLKQKDEIAILPPVNGG
jgi:MoaD family protein